MKPTLPIAVIAITLILAENGALAETTANTPISNATNGREMSVSVTPSFVSQYMFRGLRLGGVVVTVSLSYTF